MARPSPDFSVQHQAHASGSVRFHWLGHAPNPGFQLKPDELPGITTLGCWKRGKPGPPLVNEPFPLREIQVSLIEDGRAMTLRDMAGRSWPMSRPTLFCTLPWQGFSYPFSLSDGAWANLDVGVTRPNQAWRWPPWVALCAADRDELAWRWRQLESPLLRPTPGAIEAFARLGEAVREHEEGRDRLSWIAIQLNALLWHLLLLLRKDAAAEGPEAMDSRNRQTVRLFLEELARRPEALALDHFVPQMAKACGMGTGTFIAVTRETTGLTPMNWLLEKRLELAMRRMREEPEAPIHGIAAACGFASSQYFATRFRRRFGVAPKAWRKYKP